MNQLDEDATNFEKMVDFVLWKFIFGFYLITDPQVCWNKFVLSMSFSFDLENRLFVVFKERPFEVTLDEVAHFKLMSDFDDFNLFYEPIYLLSLLLYYFNYLPVTWNDLEL